MIKEIYEKAFAAAKIESSRVIDNKYIPKEYEEQVHKMGEQVMKRFLHEISSKMRNVSEESKSDMITGALQFLIKDETAHVQMQDEYKCEHSLNAAQEGTK